MHLPTARRCLFVSLLFPVLFLHPAFKEAPATPAAGSAVVIEGAQIWDGTGREPLKDAILVIRGDRIEQVGARRAVSIPKDATVFSAKGKTIIPGLINTHGHVGMVKGLRMARENYTAENVLAQLKLYARYGVTAVMSLGSDFDPIFQIRGPAKPEESPRAAVLTAGRGFTGKNGYPVVLPGNAGVQREVDSVEEVKRQVEELAQQKVNMVKIWVDDHWGHYQKIRPELYEAIIREAHRHNLRVMAHMFYLDDAKRLVRAGVDGLAHSVRDREVDDELIGLIKGKKTFAVPTLVREESTFIYAEPPAFLDDPFFNRWIAPEIISALKDPAYGKRVKSDPDFFRYPGQLKMAQKNLKKLWDAGVTIALGSDSGPPARFQGYFEHRELELMTQAGLTPAQALQAATLSAAQCLHIDRDFGTLEKGKRADLILLDGDPLLDIRNTRKINQVWIGGRQVN